MPTHYSTTEVAEKVRITTQTLKRWERLKEFIPKRDPWNRRIYTDSDIKKLKIIKARHDELLRSGSYFKGKKGSGKK